MNVQFAVRHDLSSRHYKEQISKDVTLKDLKQKFLKDFGLEEQRHEDYSLILYIREESPFYLENENISYLSKTYLIELCKARNKEIPELQKLLNSQESGMIKKALECLLNRLCVEHFLEDCINLNLHEEIFKLSDKVMRVRSDEQLTELTVSVLAELMCFSKKADLDDMDDKPYISWMNIKSDLIDKILDFVTRATEVKGLDPALKILVGCVKNNEDMQPQIFKSLDETIMMSLLDKFCNFQEKKTKTSIQTSITTLLSVMLSTNKPKEQVINQLKRYLGGNKLGSFKKKVDILSRHLKEFPSGMLPQGFSEPTKEENELINQLIKLQYSILMPVYWDYMYEPHYIGPDIRRLEMFRSIVPGCENMRDQELFDQFGFKNILNPSQDFCREKGRITADCLNFICSNYPNEISGIFSRISSSNRFKFLPSCFSLINILDRALQITNMLEGTGLGIYMPMLFENCEITDSELSKAFFYELFYRSFKVYAEHLIEAPADNLEEVEDYFLNQLNEVLVCCPMSLDDFSNWLTRSKTENLQKRKLEAQIREWEDNTITLNPIIAQLRTELEHEYRTIVNQKRIRQMQERSYSFIQGTVKNEKRFSFQLDSTKSVIFMKEESDPKSKVTQLLIMNIRKLMVGEECGHFKSRTGNFYFTMQMEDPQSEDIKQEGNTAQLRSLNFMCNNRKHFYIWIDGLNILMNKPATSQDFKEEVSNLVKMEMKVRFLLITNENIPSCQPAIPSLPTNYEFCE